MQTFDYNVIKPIQGVCGSVRESFVEGVVGFARVTMVEGISDAHYHKKTIEYYLVLEGEGILRIKNPQGNVSEVNLTPGVVVRIDINEIHQTNNKGGLILEAITTPAWTKEDENVVEEVLF
jgi:mannose-6-phosphate isomerase-like protein (cupin superfamily)